MILPVLHVAAQTGSDQHTVRERHRGGEVTTETRPAVGEGKSIEVGRDQTGAPVVAWRQHYTALGEHLQGREEIGGGQGRKVGVEDHPGTLIPAGCCERGSGGLVEPQSGFVDDGGALVPRPAGHTVIGRENGYRAPGSQCCSRHMRADCLAHPASGFGVEDRCETPFGDPERFDRNGNQCSGE